MREAYEKETVRKLKEFKVRVSMANGTNKPTSSDEDSHSDSDSSSSESSKSDQYNYSSGIDSDNDIDLLLEQEHINALKFRLKQKADEDAAKRRKGEIPIVDYKEEAP